METFEAINKRCSLKDWLSDKPIEPEKIEQILEAASKAPSSRNVQPWQFIVVQGKKEVEELVNKTFFGSSAIAKQAPVIIVACAKTEDDMVIDRKEYYLLNVGLAFQNLLLAATDLGLVTHSILCFKEDDVKALLNIPAEYRVVITTPLAYPRGGSYDEAAKERLNQRSRKKLNEIAHLNQWGKPLSD